MLASRAPRIVPFTIVLVGAMFAMSCRGRTSSGGSASVAEQRASAQSPTNRPATQQAGQRPTAHGQTAASAPRHDRVDGVDVSELTNEEQTAWRELINEELSPCGDPSTVAVCAQPAARGRCPRCVVATRYLARLVREGYERVEIDAMYRGRYNASQAVTIRTEGAAVRGTPNAPVTIVEFSDFQCPVCKAAAGPIHRLLDALPGRVQLVFKNFPLSGHERAEPAARAAAAAARQGRFWQFHDILFERQPDLEDSDLRRYASEVGLNVDEWLRDQNDAAIRSAIAADKEEGRRLGVDSTPTIFVNGHRFYEPVSALEAYVREELDGR